MREEQFEPFLKENKDRLYNYILRFVDVDDDAQDILQNAFIAFYKRLDTIDERTALSYLFQMGHNMALNWKKSNKRFVLQDPEKFANLRDTTHSRDSAPENALREAISALPAKFSSVIHMQYYDRFSYEEMSSRLGVSVKSIDSLLVRAKKMLRTWLVKNTEGKYEFKGNA